MSSTTSARSTTTPSPHVSNPGCSTASSSSQPIEVLPRRRSRGGRSVATSASTAFDRLKAESTSDLLIYLDSYLRVDLTDLVARLFRDTSDQEVGEAWQSFVCRIWKTSRVPADFNDSDHLRAYAFKGVHSACRIEIQRRRLAWGRGREGKEPIISIYENAFVDLAMASYDGPDIDGTPDSVTMLGPSRKMLDGLIKRLSTRQRDAVVMMVGHDLDRNQAATIMGCGAQAMSTARNKGVHRLRDLAQRDGLVA